MLRDELLQLVIPPWGVLPDKMGELMGGGDQHGLLFRRDFCPSVDVQIHRAVAVETVGAHIIAPLVSLRFIEHNVHPSGCRELLQNPAHLRLHLVSGGCLEGPALIGYAAITYPALPGLGFLFAGILACHCIFLRL